MSLFSDLFGPKGTPAQAKAAEVIFKELLNSIREITASVQLFGAKSVESFEKFAAAAASARSKTDALQSGFLGSIRAMSDSVTRFAGLFQQTFGGVIGTLQGYVRQGISASYAGQILSLQFQELSRQLASLFLPEIRAAVNWLQELITRFRNLSGEQQRNAAHWLEAAAFASAFTVVMPRVVNAVKAAVVAFQLLSVAVAESGIGAVVALAGAAVAAVAGIGGSAVVAKGGFEGLLAAIQPLWNALKNMGERLWKAFQPLLPAFEKMFVASLPIVESLLGLIAALGEKIAAVLVPVLDLAAAATVAIADAWKVVAEGIDLANEKLKEFSGGSVDLWDLFLPGINQLAKGLGLLRDKLGVGSGHTLGGTVADTGKKRGREELSPPVGGIEALEQTYRRIAVASIKASALGTTEPEKTNNWLRKIYEYMTQQIQEHFQGHEQAIAHPQSV